VIISYDEPETAIKIIEALADQTRRRILLHIQENPDGVTASNIAKTVNKKIPTVLHHLKMFDELHLIRSEMKPIHGTERERKVKHWFISEERLTIELDFSYIAFIPDKDIMTLFDKLRNNKNIISDLLSTNEFLTENNDGSLENYLMEINPRLNERRIDIIRHALKRQLNYYLQKWIDRDYDHSMQALALDLLEFQDHFALDRQLAEAMFNKLATSSNYDLSRLRICDKCSHDFQQQNYRFCPNCGNPVDEEETITKNRLIKKKE
jgi:DNA-binding transcriptional ArsR family regulator